MRLPSRRLSEHLASGRPDHRLTPEERRRIFGFLVGSGVAAHWDGFLTEELGSRRERPTGTFVAHGRRRR